MNNVAKREYWANLLKSRDAKPKGSKGKTMTAGCYWKSEKNSDMFGCCDLCACFDACCSIFYVIGNMSLVRPVASKQCLQRCALGAIFFI